MKITHVKLYGDDNKYKIYYIFTGNRYLEDEYALEMSQHGIRPLETYPESKIEKKFYSVKGESNGNAL